MATTKTPFQRFVDRLVKRIETEGEPQHPGVIMDYQPKEYDFGGYSDPTIDDQTPDFIKEDERGWTRLK